MKKLLLLTALVALSACMKKPEQPKENAVAPAETAAPAAPAAADSATTAPGDYEVKMADGTMAMTTINADGTYVDTDPKGKQIKGKFAHKDGKDCFDPDGDEAEMCWTVSTPGADGSFTAKSADGKMEVTVTPKKS
jgi:hypothetical protein